MATIPWQLKIPAKLVLSRLPVGYAVWKRLGVFVHGAMDDPGYSERVFRSHLERSGLAGKPGLDCLELGPGDSVSGALVARAYGARSCWLVDMGDFATRDMAVYRALRRALCGRGLAPPDEAAFASFDALLAACGARYLTNGLASLRDVPAASIDFLWSQAVLEHVRLRDFDAVLGEMRRVLRPGGVASHRVDLRDHLAGALNNLRFPEWLWEREWMARSGFYTNRLGLGEITRRCREAGFAVDLLATDRWPSLPTPRRHLAPPFRDLPDDALLVSGFDMLLRPT